MTSDNIFHLIKEKALALGFIDAGVAEVKRPEHYDRFLSWLDNGYSAGMTYLATKRALECRENPRLLMPEAKSIIVVLARYPSRQMDGRLENDVLQKISTYAWGRDYHFVLRDKLARLVEMLTEILDIPLAHHILVDGGHLLEREIAVSAGLGWIGKNSCLISTAHGSFTFLAELLIDIDIPVPKKKYEDRCGSCRRCIEACPTGCILPDRTIDSNRCISYLTIEHRGQIASDIKEKLNGWIFGCDICQMVCPWNQQIRDDFVMKDFIADDFWMKMDLVNELKTSHEEFKDRYRDSPLLRTKWKGYLRNIALSFGYHRDVSALNNLLELAACAKDEEIQSAAFWAVSRIQHGK